MNGISFLLLVLQALEVFCGLTSPNQINSENIILPVEYSWIAQLQYERGFNEQCKGSVFGTWHVLTTAKCVTGEIVETWGELIGVRLGNFVKGAHCRNSTSECTFNTDIEVAYGTEHEKYELDNDIALVRLSTQIQLEPTVNRVCLPFSIPQLTEFGYTLMINLRELTAKQVVVIPYLDRTECELQNGFMMCTGIFATTANNQITTCGRISGRARRNPLNPRKMLVKGIQFFVQGDNSSSSRLRMMYTRTRTMLYKSFIWIKKKFTNGWESLYDYVLSYLPKKLVVEHQLPTDCGYSPIYPRELIDGGYKIEPDEFTWLASLVYEKNRSAFGHCSGSVISSRYVLTAARCVNNNNHPNLGKVVGVRLGDFAKEPFCDYGTEGCGSYQYFPIESFKKHENYSFRFKRMNDIALIKLQGNIVFGDKMKPICLPFGKNNDIERPEEDSFLTVAGWWTTRFPRDVIAKRSEAVAFWNTTGCMEADRDKNTQICGVKPGESPCTTEFGSPLMNMFQRRRMVLEGIAYGGVQGCPGTDVGTLYTRVREYGEWIKSSIESLETTISYGKKSEKSDGYFTSLFNMSRNWQY